MPFLAFSSVYVVFPVCLSSDSWSNTTTKSTDVHLHLCHLLSKNRTMPFTCPFVNIDKSRHAPHKMETVLDSEI